MFWRNVVILLAASAGVTLAYAQAPPPPASKGDCELDLSATSEYASMLRDARDGFERSVAALTAKLKAAEQAKNQAQAKAAAIEARAAALERELEALKHPPVPLGKSGKENP